VLRELDTRLTSDFILISGDTVGNVDLTAAVAEHRKRRETDKNAIMTMVLILLRFSHQGILSRGILTRDCIENRCSSKHLHSTHLGKHYAHPIASNLTHAMPHFHRAKAEESLFVLDAKTGECLHYDDLAPGLKKKRTRLSLEIFDKHLDVEIRNDLIDCQIDICSIEVRPCVCLWRDIAPI
jgi:translation initiation factor eIF-2B subunit epsilon